MLVLYLAFLFICVGYNGWALIRFNGLPKEEKDKMLNSFILHPFINIMGVVFPAAFLLVWLSLYLMI